jgi:glycosyltransferase involved in cell wall biosynthesis
LVPTSIDLDAYGPPRRHIAGDRLVVGWSGSLTTASYLQLLGRALRRAAESFPLKVIVYGAQVELPGIDTECIPWSPETEVDVLRRFDVGIKPMPSEEWVRGKCPMKELQYMSLGVPPVAARFGTAGEAIDHGVTGLLCSSEDDWVEALATLRSPDLRARFGAAGRRTVEERYSAERAAAAFEGAMNAAVAGFERRRAAA